MPRTVIDLTRGSSPSAAEDLTAVHRRRFSLVKDAINITGGQELRAILVDMCRKSLRSMEMTSEYLLVPESVREVVNSEGDENEDSGTGRESGENTEEEGDEDEESGLSEEEQVTHLFASNFTHQRMRPGYASCVGCKRMYDVLRNESEDCVYHLGTFTEEARQQLLQKATS